MAWVLQTMGSRDPNGPTGARNQPCCVKLRVLQGGIATLAWPSCPGSAVPPSRTVPRGPLAGGDRRSRTSPGHMLTLDTHTHTHTHRHTHHAHTLLTLTQRVTAQSLHHQQVWKTKRSSPATSLHQWPASGRARTCPVILGGAARWAPRAKLPSPAGLKARLTSGMSGEEGSERRAEL